MMGTGRGRTGAGTTAGRGRRGLRFPDRGSAVSYTMVRVETGFALAWLALAAWIHTPILGLAACAGLAGFVGAWALHLANRHTAARILCLLMSNLSIALGAQVVDPSGNAIYMLVASIGVPFLIFDWRMHKRLIVGFAILPFLLWAVTWASGGSVLGIQEVGPEMARRFFAPATGVTVFAVALFQIGYFSHANATAARALEAVVDDLQQADRAKTTFLRSMNHEMRTPLSVILGYAELLEDVPDARNGARNIRQAGMTILSMVEKGISFSSVSAAAPVTDLDTVPLTGAAEGAAAALASLCATRGARIEVATERPGLTARADAVLLDEALRQVFENAVLYGPEGGTVTVSVSAQGTDRVRIAIANGGKGFPRGREAAAFAAFERLDRTSGNISGLGIGLTLTRRYIEAMGGSVSIDPTPAEGARVLIDLPAG